jgi:hypothetical protein
METGSKQCPLHNQSFSKSLTFTVLFFCGALSDERTGLSFVYGAGPCQCNLSRVRVPSNSWPYFTLSDLRLPFSSPPTTHRVTVEAFEPPSTRLTVPSYNSSAGTLLKTLSYVVKIACLLVPYLAIYAVLFKTYASGMCLPSRCLEAVAVYSPCLTVVA